MPTITTTLHGQQKTVRCDDGLALFMVCCEKCGHRRQVICAATTARRATAYHCPRCEVVCCLAVTGDETLYELDGSDLLEHTIETGIKAAPLERLMQELLGRCSGLVIALERPAKATENYETFIRAFGTMSQRVGLSEMLRDQIQGEAQRFIATMNNG